MQQRNARIGIILFVVYLILYAGFVLISAFAPDAMEANIAGINLAVWYGLGLIIAAFLMAMLYGFLCTAEPVAADANADKEEGR